MYNRSKRSVALDMKTPGALDIMRRLVEHADVVIENYAAGVLARWGLSWETMRSWNPRLVYVTMSGCGHEGPWNKVVSFGPTVQALCGLTALSNPPGRGDVGAGYALNDMAAGGLAAVSVLAALEARERTGEGQFVDIAQFEVGAYLVGSAVMDQLSNDRAAEPARQSSIPYADFIVNEVVPHTVDGEVAVTFATRATLPRPSTSSVRHARRARGLVRATAPATRSWTLCSQAGVPAGRVQNAHHMVTDDEHLRRARLLPGVRVARVRHALAERFPARFERVGDRAVRDPADLRGRTRIRRARWRVRHERRRDRRGHGRRPPCLDKTLSGDSTSLPHIASRNR